MKIIIGCMIAAIIAQEIRLWTLDSRYGQLLDRVLSLSRLQDKLSGLVRDLYKDLLEREEQYD